MEIEVFLLVDPETNDLFDVQLTEEDANQKNECYDCQFFVLRAKAVVTSFE